MLCQAGDGGTVDIGFGCLSGMFERNDDVLYVCYDNEGYMNTGVQRSGATPPAASTATTRPVGTSVGNAFGTGKSLPQIAMAHGVRYVATATVADLRDLEAKVDRAMEIRGARYLHVLVPCPLGWGSPAALTVRLARLATQTGLFPVFEAREGEVTGGHEDPPPRAGGGVPAPAEALRAPLHAPLGPDGAGPHPGDRRPQHPPLRPAVQGGRVMDKPFAITLNPGSSLANHTGSWRTERPEYVRTCPPATARLPGRRGHPGLALPRRERRLRGRLAADRPRQPVPRRHGARLLPPLRDRL